MSWFLARALVDLVILTVIALKLRGALQTHYDEHANDKCLCCKARGHHKTWCYLA